MVEALSVVWYSIKDLWDEFLMLVVMNMLWALTATLPLAAVQSFVFGYQLCHLTAGSLI